MSRKSTPKSGKASGPSIVPTAAPPVAAPAAAAKPNPANQAKLLALPDLDRHTVTRWRLALGKDAEASGLQLSGEGDEQEIDDALGFLYADKDKGSSDPSKLTVPSWIDAVNELFPKQAKEVLERELIRRRGIAEILDQPKLLEKVEPNVELVKTLLTHKDLLNEKTRVLARKVIQKVVDELKKKLEVRIEQAIIGALRKDRHSPRKVFRNLDLKTTLRRNLKNWDPEINKLLIDKVFYYAAEKNKRPWHIVVCVDQSGSMLESAIFSAVMASIFAELPGIKTSLVLFDTQIVDLSDKVGEPVDVLLKVQLGGGTDITQALQYCQQIIQEPARTIVVLITDFYEGRNEEDLVRVVRQMSDSNVRMVGLGALGYDAQPQYNKATAGKLRKVGMDILVCTPEKLAECMGEIIRGKR
jgi:Mg-chelatase subunit ChlD